MTLPHSLLPQVSLFALTGIPRVQKGDDLADLILHSCESAGLEFADDDVLVVAQKIVSKAEGRSVRLDSIEPSPRAIELAVAVDKDPRMVELVLRESRSVRRHKLGVLIVEDVRGLVLANAGIDHSNVEQGAQEGTAALDSPSEIRAGEPPDDTPPCNVVLLLPEDPDASAQKLRGELEHRTGKRLGIVINDSLGRAWRVGTVGVAIGCAGVESVQDLRGQPDLFGQELRTTDVGHADQIAAAASIVMGQSAEGVPVVVVRGLPRPRVERPAVDAVRPADQDLFR